MQDLEELRKVALLATKGIWKTAIQDSNHGKFQTIVTDENGNEIFDLWDSGNNYNDSNYMAAANPAVVLELITRCENAEKEREEWKLHAEKQSADATARMIQAMENGAEVNALRDELKELREQKTVPPILHICPIKDIECGNHADYWCDTCPKNPSSNTDKVEISPELLKYLQTNTEVGSIICTNYAGGYSLIEDFILKMVWHESWK